MNTETTSRILIVEDMEADAELAMHELRRAGLGFEARRVDRRDQFVEALEAFSPDVILSDFALPQFNGLDALRILRERGVEIPFILCTGSLTEEVAVECMKEGAFDYLLKSSLKRLPSAVLHALEANESRRQRLDAVEALRLSEVKFRSIVETSNEWIWEMDLEGRITYSNPAVQGILGYPGQEVVGRSVWDLIQEDDLPLASELYKEAIRAGKGWSQLVRRFRNQKGEIRYLEGNAAPILGSRDELTGFRGNDHDITERKQAEEQLLHDAFHDGLSGLANRKLFMEHLQLCIERGKGQRRTEYAVLYLDFDRFKVVNDSLGHSAGDNLLQSIARRLESCTNPGDLVSRFGGDEFVILLSNLAQTAEALVVAERIISDLNTPFALGSREIYISTSIGIAMSSPAVTAAEDMIRDADIAMYAAKAKGGSQYQVFTEAMHQHATTRLQVETDLRNAFDRGEFCLHYQPIVHLETGSLAGFESLIRWQHPERGLISPNEFIPIAEDNGLILKIGEWTVLESCKQMRQWQEAFPIAENLTISVNLSTREFRQPDLAMRVVDALQSTGLSPRCLKLEITESHIIDNTDLAITIISRLQKLGVEFSLDDFGTGYSSLSYLHRLPFRYLKIDRSFVNLMGESNENYTIVHTIIRLARSLGMKAIAEGIETEEQAAFLRNLQCTYGQGFLYSKPMSAEDAARFLEGQVSIHNTGASGDDSREESSRMGMWADDQNEAVPERLKLDLRRQHGDQPEQISDANGDKPYLSN